ITRVADRALSPVMGKSVVFYASKPADVPEATVSQ
ncbi:MAG: SAM-dependent methyltransferase, partial [Ilumatobacteraceae bacterium]|nr:SAM-dependent methyltransferase [Ilumatobacteraceae bacterium]